MDCNQFVSRNFHCKKNQWWPWKLWLSDLAFKFWFFYRQRFFLEVISSQQKVKSNSCKSKWGHPALKFDHPFRISLHCISNCDLVYFRNHWKFSSIHNVDASSSYRRSMHIKNNVFNYIINLLVERKNIKNGIFISKWPAAPKRHFKVRRPFKWACQLTLRLETY